MRRLTVFIRRYSIDTTDQIDAKNKTKSSNVAGSLHILACTIDRSVTECEVLPMFLFSAPLAWLILVQISLSNNSNDESEA